MSRTFAGVVLALGFVFSASAMAQETEPNNPCNIAQDFGRPPLPTSVFGELTSTPEAPDVDFFRFSFAAGQTLQVDLQGSSTGQGTLTDPYLGLFDSSCNLVAVDDDSGGSLNSRLVFEVPVDEVVTLGVTNCCDGAFAGGGQGSYLLTVSTLAAIDTITGRLVNADTGAGLPGFESPFASAQLFRCDPVSGCFEFVGFQQADGDGRFSFTTDQLGNPIAAGTYQVIASANGYETFTSGQFDVAEGEFLDLGDLPLTPFQLIGSISGRAVDAVTGEPISGSGPPFASIFLERCDSGGCFIIAGASPDVDGRFVFDGALSFIPPGTFRLRGFAEDYVEAVSAEFPVGAFEDVDTGDFPLTPFPIRFGAVQECQIPFGGGACDYGIEITNRSPDRYRGEAWSIVEVFPPGAARNTRFQLGSNGAGMPIPQRINLRQGESMTLSFQLEVPPRVADGTTVCATVTVGRDPVPQFRNQGDRFVFCSVKQSNGFEALSGKDGRRLYRELTGRGETRGRRH
jgi:hypothetical protein